MVSPVACCSLVQLPHLVGRMMHAWSTPLCCCLILLICSNSNISSVAVSVFGTKCYLNKSVTVSTEASCGSECASWHLYKSVQWRYGLAHLVLLELRAFGEIDVWCQEMCLVFECTYLQSTFFVMLETSLVLIFIDCRYSPFL